jgi:hypothetical protein
MDLKITIRDQQIKRIQRNFCTSNTYNTYNHSVEPYLFSGNLNFPLISTVIMRAIRIDTIYGNFGDFRFIVVSIRRAIRTKTWHIFLNTRGHRDTEMMKTKEIHETIANLPTSFNTYNLFNLYSLVRLR